MKRPPVAEDARPEPRYALDAGVDYAQLTHTVADALKLVREPHAATTSPSEMRTDLAHIAAPCQGGPAEL